jgi:hypothetical protein
MADFKGWRHTNATTESHTEPYQNSKISIEYNDGQISERINTNKGVRQGCGLSPDLFNRYINKAIREVSYKGIETNHSKWHPAEVRENDSNNIIC